VDIAQNICACAVFIFATKVLEDIPNLIPSCRVAILVAELSLQLVFVFFAIHAVLAVFAEHCSDNSDRILKALGEFVLLVLFRKIVEIVQLPLCETSSMIEGGIIPTYLSNLESRAVVRTKA
jgi:hypothetical protein